MAHLLRTIPDSLLVRGYVTTGADLAAIDQKTFVAINGDEGGTWSPSSPIIIGGTGVIVAGAWVMSTVGVNVVTSMDKFITFDKGTKGDFFGLDPAHPLASPAVRTGFNDYFTPVIGSVAWFGGLVTGFTGARFFTPLNVWSGAPTIDYVEVTWRVSEAHADVPQFLPRMRVIAVTDEGIVIPLRARDTTTDIDGFQYLPTPASGVAYYNAAAPQTWTYVCNIVLPVDSAKYVYYLEFIEESGDDSWVTDGNQFYSAIAYHSNVTIFDGRN